MEESIAPKAERSYNNNASSAYVAVRIKGDKAVIEELYVDHMPIRKFVERDLFSLYHI